MINYLLNDTRHDDGHWFTAEEVRRYERSHNAKYIGRWYIRTKEGEYDERYQEPLDVFYCPDQNTSPSRERYFAMYKTEDGTPWTTSIGGTFDREIEVLETGPGLYYEWSSIYSLFGDWKRSKIKVVNGEVFTVGETD